MILLFTVLSSIILYWAASYLKISNKLELKKSYVTAFKTMLSQGVFMYILSMTGSSAVILGWVFLVYFIKYFYKIDIKKSIKLWLYYLLFLLPVLVIIAIITSIPDITKILQSQH